MVRRSARTRRMETSSAPLARWGAAATSLGGISYGAWGYLDNPDASEFVIGTVVPVLGLTTPTLFLGGLICLYSWLGRGAGPLQRTGLLVGLLGTRLGVINGLDWGMRAGGGRCYVPASRLWAWAWLSRTHHGF
jgi:hypothetical protein